MRGTASIELSRPAVLRKMNASEELPTAKMVEIAVNIQKRVPRADAGTLGRGLDFASSSAVVPASPLSAAFLRGSRRKKTITSTERIPGTIVQANTAFRLLDVASRIM